LELRIDGVLYISRSVKEESWRYYVKTIPVLPSGRHTINVNYPNDFDGPPECNRNLQVDKVTLKSVADTPTDPDDTAGGADKLAFAPPALTDPITVNVPSNDSAYNGHTNLNLSTTRDYIINMPATKKVGGLSIIGGNDVVLIGGHISSNPLHVEGSSTRALYVKDSTGTVFIEGVETDYSSGGEYDFMEMDAPQATVVLQNIRAEKVTGSRDGVHGDVIQPYGGIDSVKIDKLTATSNYQGLQLYDLADSADIRRVDMAFYDNPNISEFSNQFVWLECSSSNYAFSEVFVSSSKQGLGSLVWTTTSDDTCPAQYTDSTRKAVRWPSILGVTGVVSQGPPPNGSFVPADKAGLNYVSPGYQ
jgi:hypothetical protein